MKIVHLSDLHLGKRVNEFSMIEDQKYILSKIITIIDEEKPDVIIIAGDVYDKSIPPVEAVSLFDDFLNRLSERKLPVLIISGNHDSAERLSFGNRIMEAGNIFVASAYNGVVKPVVLKDEFGPVNFYLLPFIKPSNVRPFFEQADARGEIEDYTGAVATAIKQMNINKTERNVLVSHQFVTGAARCDSEEISVGGLDNVDVSVFADFDYVALGHIHGPQKIGNERICYSGTPLKYSFSECNHKKGVKIVSLGEKNGNDNSLAVIKSKFVPLVPLHDMRELKGKYDDLMFKKNYENTNTEDYVHITLTDEEDILNGFSRLQTVYKNLMKLDYDNARTRNVNTIETGGEADSLSPIELFEQFYKLQNNKELDDGQRSFMSDLIEEIWEGTK